MKYTTGEEIKLWDRVQMWDGCKAIVVFSNDSKEYSPAFPENEWSYLGSGVMFATDKAGLIFSSEVDPCTTFIGRGNPPSDREWAPFKESCSAQGGAKPPSAEELNK